MQPDFLPTEIILTNSQECLGTVQLDWKPQPGNYVTVEGKTYTVLERHHHYQYKIGGYCLQKMSIYVQSAQIPSERTFFEDRWVIGDISCRYNARSEIFRCAVNPTGPCLNCRAYEAFPQN